MGLGMTIEVDAKMERIAHGLSQGVVQNEVVLPVLDQAVYKTARAFYMATKVYLQEAVYAAPPPPSASKNAGGKHGRTGNTMRAIKLQKEAVMPEGRIYKVFVDRSNYPAYYYAWILNYGGYMSRAGVYPAKMYWSNGIDYIRGAAAAIGEEGLKSMARAIEDMMARAV